jgi:short-subunit dehydrogenase
MIVITGASDGLGHELAKLFKASGKTVVNISRRKCDFADYNLLNDLSKGEEIKAAAEEIKKIDEQLEVLINNAGVYSEEAIGDITEGEIKRLMSTNVKSNILLTSELIEKIKNDQADVLSVISTAGTKGKAAHSVYATSKWAQRGYTYSLQDELKNTACRVIAFCPGGINTHFPEKAESFDDTADRSDWMDPAELAKLIKQLLDLPKNMEVSDIVVNRKSVK